MSSNMDALLPLMKWLGGKGLLPPKLLLDILKRYNPRWGHPSYYLPSPPPPDGHTTIEIRGHDGAI